MHVAIVYRCGYVGRICMLPLCIGVGMWVWVGLEVEGGGYVAPHSGPLIPPAATHTSRQQHGTPYWVCMRMAGMSSKPRKKTTLPPATPHRAREGTNFFAR